MSLEQKWAQAITGNIDAQVKLFLRAFVLDFQGKFEEVLDIAENYKNFAQGVAEEDRHTIKELGEFDCHLFLEKRGETLTVRSLRENLKAEIRLDPHHNVAILEY